MTHAFRYAVRPEYKFPEQQQHQTPTRARHQRQAFSLKNIEPRRITTFWQNVLAFPATGRGGAVRCEHALPPPPLKALEARFQAFVLRK